VVERIIHSSDRLEIIEGLKAMPDVLEREITGLSDQVLRFRPAGGGWSIKEVVGHMRDSAEAWNKRLFQVWAQNDPLFVPYDQDAYVRDRGYQDAALGQVLADMRKFRLETVELLAHAVDWTRLGQWPGVGRRTLKQLAEAVLQSEKDHIEQIRSLKVAGAATAGS
jgi:hypothetical protein